MKLKSLPLTSCNILYRGAKMSNTKIIKLKSYIEKKIDYLSSSIVFSKSFLSFSKERKVAEFFLNYSSNIDENLSKVFFL